MSREDLESELNDNPDFAVGLLRKLAEEMRGQSKARLSTKWLFHTFIDMRVNFSRH